MKTLIYTGLCSLKVILELAREQRSYLENNDSVSSVSIKVLDDMFTDLSLTCLGVPYRGICLRHYGYLNEHFFDMLLLITDSVKSSRLFSWNIYAE